MASDSAGQSYGPTARRMVLGYQLRKLREAVGTSRADVGYQIRGLEQVSSRTSPAGGSATAI